MRGPIEIARIIHYYQGPSTNNVTALLNVFGLFFFLFSSCHRSFGSLTIPQKSPNSEYTSHLVKNIIIQQVQQIQQVVRCFDFQRHFDPFPYLVLLKALQI